MKPNLSMWPPPELGGLLRRPRRRLPFPLNDPNCTRFALGRHALWHAIRALGLKEGDEVLIPAFNHGSEVEPYVRAGITPRFYEVTDDLEPDERSLEAAGGGVRALHLIHYLGFPQDVARWRACCDERGWYLIEDAAQAMLATSGGDPVGTHADAAIYCLYKAFGVPDGGALFTRSHVKPFPSRATYGLRPVIQRVATRLGLRGSGSGAGGGRTSSAAFALGDPNSEPSRITAHLIDRIADDRSAYVRRDNYALLLDRLGDLVPAPFDNLVPGASPFAFPIEVNDRDRVRTTLRGVGIRAESFWADPHPSIEGEFPNASARRMRTIALPVHQYLTRAALDRIATNVRAVTLEP